MASCGVPEANALLLARDEVPGTAGSSPPSSSSYGSSSGPSSVASDSDDGKSEHGDGKMLDYPSVGLALPGARLGQQGVAASVRPTAYERTGHHHLGAPASPGSGRKKRVAHTKEAIALLKDWLLSEEHVHNPYPTEAEKKDLMRRTGLDKKQLTNWFTNARKRIWQPRYGPTPKSKKMDGTEGGAAGGGAGTAAAAAASLPLPTAPRSKTAKAASALNLSQRTEQSAPAAELPELETPLQRKRDRARPTLEPTLLDLPSAVHHSGGASGAGAGKRPGLAVTEVASPRGPKTPRLEQHHPPPHSPALPAMASAAVRATPDAELQMSLFDFHDAQRFSDPINPMLRLTPVHGFEDTLGSPVECAWLESSH